MVRKALLLLAFLPTTLFAKSYGEFDVSAPPQWIDRAQADYGSAVPSSLGRYGVYDILSDHQIQVGRSGETAHYFRTVRKVLTQAGVQNASQLTIDFDPSFQRLLIHDITIIRGAISANALDPSGIRVIEKEDDADSAIYDGRLSALIFLKDVRAGDVIDWSWSIEGANPILRGHYADEYDLRSDIPTRRVRHRLIWNGTRQLQTRGRAPLVEANTYTWEALDVAAVDLEDSLPSWYEPWEVVEATDFASWNEVARWSTETFAVDQESIDAVTELADKIRQEHPEDPVTAGIRFVQDDIRYLGLEIGRNSHEPRQPKEILEQRWGDCKEKALLLSLLLREFGYAADPALVNTKAKQRLDQRLPSPFAFDHVVVRVVAKQRTYWIDSTIADQGGTLETMETPNDSRALVVRDDSTTLQRIATLHRGRTLIEETYAAQDASSPTSLVVQSTYSGTDADLVRADFASMGAEDIARDRINRYASDHPSIVSTSAPQVRDDRGANIIVITEHYSIRDLWKRGGWTYYPRALESSLDKPKTIVRSMPLAFDYPLDIVERATFRFPHGAEIEAEPMSKKTTAFAFRFTPVERADRAVMLEYSLRSLRDSVPARDVPKHLTAINEISDEAGCTINPSFATPTTRMGLLGGQWETWLWALAAALVVTGFAFARFWKLSLSKRGWLRN